MGGMGLVVGSWAKYMRAHFPVTGRGAPIKNGGFTTNYSWTEFYEL